MAESADVITGIIHCGAGLYVAYNTSVRFGRSVVRLITPFALTVEVENVKKSNTLFTGCVS